MAERPAVDWELCDEIAEAGLTEAGSAFEASYRGRCPCGDEWSPGDLIAWVPGEETFGHADCAAG